MRVILLGATGMVGQGVLRECLLAPDVAAVLAVGRRRTAQEHPKLRELLVDDLGDLGRHASELGGFDACFFCLGVSSAGMDESSYRRITKDLTLAVAALLAEVNPGMTFVYVSGAGSDASEGGRSMWARVKGETENALLRLPLKVYLFRPGYIQPLHGISSRTTWYRVVYAVVGPFYPLWKTLFPSQLTTTELVGKAMLAVARERPGKSVLETPDINELARG